MILSPSNPSIKWLKKLTVHKYRKREKVFLVDDYKIVEEALKCHYLPDKVFVSRDFPQFSHLNLIKVQESILASISDLASFSGIIAVFPLPLVDLKTIAGEKQIILLDGVQDPVNVGTILRSSSLFGITGAVLLSPCADPYSLKAIRAGKGAVFHLPIAKLTKEQLPSLVSQKNLYAADAGKGQALYKVEIKEPFVLVMGGEGHGLSDNVKKLNGNNILIPTTGKIDSLNVGSAASIILSYIYNKTKGK